MNKWGFSEEQSEAISKLHLKDGYAALSRKAVNNILPFLERGYTYDIAVVLGGIRNAFGDQWESLTAEQIDFLLDHVPGIVRSNVPGGYFLERERNNAWLRSVVDGLNYRTSLETAVLDIAEVPGRCRAQRPQLPDLTRDRCARHRPGTSA